MRAITIDADTGKRVYTRKEVADLVGASTQSIRLWEDAGAIPASVRDEGGYRYWYEEDLEAIKLMPHYREKQNLKSSPKCEESVTALLFFFVLNFEGYLKIYRLCD